MNIENGTLVKLNLKGHSDHDGSLGVVLKTMRGLSDSDSLFEVFLLDKSESRWYKRMNLQVLM